MSSQAINNQTSYNGQSISQLNDLEKKEEIANNQIGGKQRGSNVIEDQFNKKQMEFKGGKLHQMISDTVKNSNKIYANRY